MCWIFGAAYKWCLFHDRNIDVLPSRLSHGVNFGEYTRGDEGFVIQQADRAIGSIDLTSPAGRFYAALLLFTICFFIIAYIVRSGFGLALVAIRENEERASMLGYDVLRLKLTAVIISGVMAGAAGAAYALLFGYAGATFATVQYSILFSHCYGFCLVALALRSGHWLAQSSCSILLIIRVPLHLLIC